MKELHIVYHKKQKKITFYYDNNSQWNLFDVEEGSGTLEIFGRIKYAIDNNIMISLEEL